MFEGFFGWFFGFCWVVVVVFLFYLFVWGLFCFSFGISDSQSCAAGEITNMNVQGETLFHTDQQLQVLVSEQTALEF